MSLHPPRARHNQLFELLRQEQLAEQTCARLRAVDRTTGQGDAMLLQSLAVASFRDPALASASVYGASGD